jgi:hypothetical protein
MQFGVDARTVLSVYVPSSVMIKCVGSGAVRALSSAPVDDERRIDREFIAFLKAQVAHLNEVLSAKETQFSAKETQLSAKETQFKEMLSAKETQLSAKEAQLEKARDARDAWQEERLTLSHKRAVLERERMAGLAALGKIDLRRVLESIFPANARTRRSIQTFVECNGIFLERCRAEPKIQAEVRDRTMKQVTPESIAIELRRIWDDLHSDVHLQLSVEEWKTCRPEQPMVLKVNGITQARVLLLYHLLDHCGYPVEAEGVIPNGLR